MPSPPDITRRSRRGPLPIDAEAKRGHCVSVRVNAAELAQLDQQRAPVEMKRGEYLRAAALHRLPPTIPAINREAWAAMARVAGTLNQYQRAINEGKAHGHPPEAIDELRALVSQFRLDLIGAAPPREHRAHKYTNEDQDDED